METIFKVNGIETTDRQISARIVTRCQFCYSLELWDVLGGKITRVRTSWYLDPDGTKHEITYPAETGIYSSMDHNQSAA
jgi:hypothetical protein